MKPMSNDLFETSIDTALSEDPAVRRKELGQYFTPVWAAEALRDMFFADLKAGDVVIEPTCGDGRFLQVLPDDVRAIGVEIDPVHAEAARLRTGRQVLTGDFCKIDLPVCDGEVDAMIGNPPYTLDVVDGILDRAGRLLHPRHGRFGAILPAYAFQTPGRVMRYARDWVLEAHCLPRTLFPGLSKPLIFAMFRKEGQQWKGLALYSEAADVETMPEETRDTLQNSSGSVWKNAVSHALKDLGGQASLQELYAAIGPRRPSATQWWKEKIRQVARQHFTLKSKGVYALA